MRALYKHRQTQISGNPRKFVLKMYHKMYQTYIICTKNSTEIDKQLHTNVEIKIDAQTVLVFNVKTGHQKKKIPNDFKRIAVSII